VRNRRGEVRCFCHCTFEDDKSVIKCKVLKHLGLFFQMSHLCYRWGVICYSTDGIECMVCILKFVIKVINVPLSNVNVFLQ
jgi:hypothetical protein